MRLASAKLRVGVRAGRYVHCVGRLVTAACLTIGALPNSTFAAEPALRPDRFVGPLRGFFTDEESSLGTPAFLMAGERPNRRLYRYRVKVDSTGVMYTRRAAGALTGQTMGLALEDHLALTFERDLSRSWSRKVRRDFIAVSRQQVRGRKNRLEWSVPFSPKSKHLRRFLGDMDPTLKINGQIKTTIGGRSQWTSGEVQTVAGRPSKFPSLSLEQEQKFTVEGKVGELINIRITQDTQSVTSFSDQLANQVKLDFKGEEDAIFQEVQAGNTTLSLPGTKFVGFRQQHKGLFGIRAKGRVGPMAFTTIASHEKSKGNRRTFRGGARADTVVKRDHEYTPRKFFFLDRFYRDNLPDFRRLQEGLQFGPENAVDDISLEVYVNDFNTRNDAERLAKEGVAWVDVNGPIIEESGFVERGTWHRLDPDNDYVLVAGAGFINLRRAVGDREALAVSYRSVGGQQFGETRGDTLKLKLIKAQDARATFPTWNLEWKNVYQIASSFSRGRKFDRETIEIQILKETPGREPQASQDGKSYLQVFGLDEHGQDQGSPPDRRIDADYLGLDELQGLLILPDLSPFNPEHSEFQLALKDTVPEIYNTQQSRDKIEASQFIIQAITISSQQRISLGLGVNPASVEVLLNGERLRTGSDYNVGFTGDVSFTRSTADRVSQPGAELEINYESEDLFGGLGSQQKTLLGMRTEYEFWDGDGILGGTMTYNNERTSDRRVRVGSEPARTVVWDMDVRAKFAAPLLTRLVDSMPLLKTATPSDIKLQAEIAESRPNLNTKGVGFIDDFEGSERPTSLFVRRVRWTRATRPENLFLSEADRGNIIWYNPVGKLLRADIWPGQESQVESTNETTDILTLELEPKPEAMESWGGIMAAFSTINDLSQSKFLEVWVRGDDGILHIDLGTIGEDVNDNNRLDTEDLPVGGLSSGDGVVSPEEDVGIDGRDLTAELQFYLDEAGIAAAGMSVEEMKAEFGRAYPDRDPDDPENDNFSFDHNRDPVDYSHINGTEKNSNADSGGSRPDTEDLNNDGVVETRNDYYHYAIDLGMDVPVPGTEHNGWRMFRLPLYSAEVERVGKPDSSRVEFARLTITGGVAASDEVIKVDIALMEIIENQWQEDDVLALPDAFAVNDDETINISVVGTDKDVGYLPPPRVKVRRVVGSTAREREQSLVLDYENLEPGHQVAATRVLRKNANYTKYTRLRMYVHGDSLDSYVVGPDSSSMELFVRFGADTTNYYEVISQVFPGWDNGIDGWRGNEVEVDLLTMAFLKGRLQNMPADSTGRFPTLLDSIVVDSDLRGGEPALYRIRGNPSMQQVRQLTIGLRNRGDQDFSGRVFVDELRLDAVRNDPGRAAYMKVATNLADFMNVDSEVTWQQEDFRTINDTGRNRSDLKTSINTKTQLDKLLPGRWAVSIPLRANFSRDKSLPRFGPNSDVELTQTEKEAQSSELTKEFFDLQVSKRAGAKWYLRWTIDQMKLGLSHSQNRGFSPTQPVNNQEAQSMNFSYRMPLPKNHINPLRWSSGLMPDGFAKLKFYYLPSNLSYSMRVNRKETESLRRADADTTFHETFTMKETYTAKVNPLSGLSADYSLGLDRDMRKKYEPKDLSFGREVKRNQKADTKFRLSLVRWLEQNYTAQATYDEINDPTRRTGQVVLDSLTGAVLDARDINTKNNISAKYNFKVGILLKSLGGSSKGKEDKPFILRRLLGEVGGVLDPVNTTWRRDSSGSNFNLVSRPTLSYQLGLNDQLNVRQVGTGLTKQDQRSRSNQLDLSGGLKLPQGIRIKPSFSRKQTRRSGSTQSRLRVEEQRVYPKTTISWSKADRLPLIRRLVSSSQVSVTFQTTRSRQGEQNLSPGNLISRGKDTEFTTSWNGRVRIGPTLNVKRTRSTGVEFDFELAGLSDTVDVVAAKPLRGSTSREKEATTFTTSYNLRPRNLPLFGKIKGNVDLKYEFGLESEVRSSATSDAERAPISDSNKWKTSLKATYKFSDNFRGEGLVRLENNRNRLTDKTRKTRELRLTGTLFFR